MNLVSILSADTAACSIQELRPLYSIWTLSPIFFSSAMTDSEILNELRRYYGYQLNRIERVIVEELGLWADWDIGDAIEMLGSFGGLQLVRIILENYEFSDDDEPPPTAADCLKTANALLARDGPMLQERNWRVE